jgi:hypothetical protein
MDEKIIRVAQFNDYLQAEIAKIALESEDIPCYLGGENFVAAYGLYSNAVGGIELCIKESDKQRALEILQKLNKSEPAEQNEDYDIVCPKCKSANISYENFSRWAFLLSFLVFSHVPVSYPVKKYTCKSCGHKWKKAKTSD